MILKICSSLDGSVILCDLWFGKGLSIFLMYSATSETLKASLFYSFYCYFHRTVLREHGLNISNIIVINNYSDILSKQSVCKRKMPKQNLMLLSCFKLRFQTDDSKTEFLLNYHYDHHTLFSKCFCNLTCEVPKPVVAAYFTIILLIFAIVLLYCRRDTHCFSINFKDNP